MVFLLGCYIITLTWGWVFPSKYMVCFFICLNRGDFFFFKEKRHYSLLFADEMIFREGDINDAQKRVRQSPNWCPGWVRGDGHQGISGDLALEVRAVTMASGGKTEHTERGERRLSVQKQLFFDCFHTHMRTRTHTHILCQVLPSSCWSLAGLGEAHILTGRTQDPWGVATCQW